jgi:hypothetical protein
MYMETRDKAYRILIETEAALASLAAEASNARNYDAASDALELARDVKRLAERTTSTPTGLGNGQSARSNEATRDASRLENRGHRSVRRLGVYPTFYRVDDYLVKVGWSKSDKSEYEHKCPKAGLLTLIDALQRAGARGRRFTMERVFSLLEVKGASELPSYQVYVGLAWLKANGLIAQHGRQGYTLVDAQALPQSAEASWNGLPRQ